MDDERIFQLDEEPFIEEDEYIDNEFRLNDVDEDDEEIEDYNHSILTENENEDENL